MSCSNLSLTVLCTIGQICTFDDDGTDEFCGFYNGEASSGANLNWRLRTGDESGTGAAGPIHDTLRPGYDHTLAEDYGKYLYFESDISVNAGDLARQISAIHKFDLVDGSSDLCLR